MKMRHLFALMIFSVCAVAGLGNGNVALAQALDGDVQTDITGRNLGPDGKPDYKFSLVIPEQVIQPENHYLAKLRDQLNRHKMEVAQKDHAATPSFVKFTKETATFFVAIAAVQFQAMLIDYADNPSGLAKQISSINDPIANASFYMFLLTQGHTVRILEGMLKPKDDVSMQIAKRRLGYIGMGAGTLVSGLTTEILTNLKDCGKTLFPNPKDSEQNNADLQVCDAALKTWTASKVVQRYTPQVLSLLATAGAINFVESVGGRLLTYSGAQLAKALSLESGAAFRFVGIRLGFLGSPSGWFVTGVSVVGTIGKYYAFTNVSEWFSPIFEKLAGNIFKPIEFHFDAKNFEASVKKSKEYNWMDQKSNLQVAKELSDMTDLMARWRQQQLAKFYTAHSVWGENTMRVIDQTNTTFNFYKVYLENLFKTLQVGTKIRNKQLPPEAMNTVTYYPFRILPLYGVRVEADPMALEAVEDQYLNQPLDLEFQQKKTVHAAAGFIREGLKSMRATQEDQKWLQDILQAFDGNDALVMGKALLKLNTVAKNQAMVKVEGKAQLQRIPLSNDFQRLMMKTRQFLGRPEPILTQGLGFSYAYETNTFNNKAMRELQRPLAPGVERVRTSDYMWIQMACGSVDQYYSNVRGFIPYFKPPKLIKTDLRIPDLCRLGYSGLRTSDGHEADIYTYPFKASDGKTYQGVNDAIYVNLRPEILGNFTSDKGELQFSKWWFDNVSTSMTALFQDFDEEYIHVLQHLTDNWTERKLSYLDKLNYSSYLSKDVLENLSFELNIYANVLNELMSGRVPKDRQKLQAGNPGNDNGALDANVEMEDLSKHPRVKGYHPSGHQKISPTIAAIAANLPTPPLEDKQGLLARLKAAAGTDITARQKLNEAAKARAAVNVAKAQLKNIPSTPEISAVEAARYSKYYSAEVARLDKIAVAAEKIAQDTVARLKPQTQDTSLVRGERYAKLKEIADLVEATQIRINTLRKMRVVKGPNSKLFVENFPTKEASKAEAEATTKAMTALGDLVKSIQLTERGPFAGSAPANAFGPTQAEIATQALKGLESVISEVGSLTMAFYTTKYKLGDDAGEMMAELKASQVGAAKVKAGVHTANGL